MSGLNIGICDPVCSISRWQFLCLGQYVNTTTIMCLTNQNIAIIHDINDD